MTAYRLCCSRRSRNDLTECCCCRAELDIDVRWAGEPDVLLKLEPSNKWLMNAVKIGEVDCTHLMACALCAPRVCMQVEKREGHAENPPSHEPRNVKDACLAGYSRDHCGAGKLKVLPAVNMTPVMAVRVRTVQMSAVLRVTMSPVLDDLPFIGGVALSFMTQPYLDFDLR